MNWPYISFISTYYTHTHTENNIFLFVRLGNNYNLFFSCSIYKYILLFTLPTNQLTLFLFFFFFLIFYFEIKFFMDHHHNHSNQIFILFYLYINSIYGFSYLNGNTYMLLKEIYNQYTKKKNNYLTVFSSYFKNYDTFISYSSRIYLE